MIYFIPFVWPLSPSSYTMCSFYKSNYVQRFHYSRPVRKGPVDPNNEFAVSFFFFFFLYVKIYVHGEHESFRSYSVLVLLSAWKDEFLFLK